MNEINHCRVIIKKAQILKISNEFYWEKKPKHILETFRITTIFEIFLLYFPHNMWNTLDWKRHVHWFFNWHWLITFIVAIENFEMFLFCLILAASPSKSVLSKFIDVFVNDWWNISSVIINVCFKLKSSALTELSSQFMCDALVRHSCKTIDSKCAKCCRSIEYEFCTVDYNIASHTRPQLVLMCSAKTCHDSSLPYATRHSPLKNNTVGRCNQWTVVWKLSNSIQLFWEIIGLALILQTNFIRSKSIRMELFLMGNFSRCMRRITFVLHFGYSNKTLRISMARAKITKNTGRNNSWNFRRL